MRWSDVRGLFALTLFFLILTCGLPVLAQAAVGAIGTPNSPVSSSEDFGGLVIGFYATSVWEWLKRQTWFGLVSEKTQWGVQRALGILIAIATAVGVHWTFSDGTLTVTGLSVGMMWDAFRQFALQELVYRNGVKNYRRGVLA